MAGIPLAVISDDFDDFPGVMAGKIARQFQGKSSLSSRISGNLLRVVSHTGGRNLSPQPGLLARDFRRSHLPLHTADIGHGPSDTLLRHFQRLHQSLAHCPQRGLTEISALRMFRVCPSGHQGKAQIGNRRSRQHTNMFRP